MREQTFLGFTLWFTLSFLLVYIYRRSDRTSSSSPQIIDNRELVGLQQQCQRLRWELEQRSQQVTEDIHSTTFEQLQTLLTNYPTACKMAEAKPNLPAKNLIALFTPLENLITSWGYETIGIPWQQVPYNPQIHQADSDDIEIDESVYVRFIGYRQGEKIIYPAKVSRSLPPGINPENTETI